MMLTFHVSASGSTVAGSVGHRFVGIWCFCVAGMETPALACELENRLACESAELESIIRVEMEQIAACARTRASNSDFDFMIILKAVYTGLKPQVPRLVPKMRGVRAEVRDPTVRQHSR